MKVLLADDHVLFREGLRMVLEHLVGEGLSVTEAGDFAQAITVARAEPAFDLALVDLFMPGMDGAAGVQALRKLIPDATIIVLSASEDPRDVARALDAGARGYIAKSSGSQALMAGIESAIENGQVVVPAHLMPAPGDLAKETGSGIPQLTPRQIDVLTMVAKGKSNKEIARELNLAEITVKLHVTAILKTLGCENRTQAAILAQKMGIA